MTQVNVLQEASQVVIDGDDVDVISVGVPGPSGPPGAGLNIVGTVATVGDLPLTGNPGDAYLVGTGSSKELYVWSA